VRKISIYACTFIFAAATLALTLSNPASAATTRTLIVSPVDETKLVTLTGNTRSAALDPKNDRGPVDDSLQLDHMLLLLQRPAESDAALKSLTDAMHTPGSPEFHKWLSAEELGSRFGLAEGDLQNIAGWLQAHGFTVNRVYPNGTLIDFSGNAGQVREAFHTELHNLEVKGEKHIANVSDPRIPVALAPAIRGIVSLNDFRPHTMHTQLVQAHIDGKSGKLVSAAAGGAAPNSFKPDYTFTSGGYTYQAVVPGDLETIYNMNPLFAAGYSGQGQTIVLIEDTNLYTTKDWTTFRSTFGLSKYTAGTLTQVHPGSCTNPGVNGDDGEAILDVEYASAAAPSAAIELASCADTNTTFGGLIALQNLLNASKTPPALVSISYGECESENGATANASYSSAYEQGVVEGVSIFVSAGDEGAASCDADESYATQGITVSGFASTSYNVAVGGTDFGDTYAGTASTYWNTANTSSYESAKSYINEIPWNDSCASVLLSTYETGSGVTYGTKGFCNSSAGEDYFLTTASGSGGPSNCFTGSGSSCKGNPKPSWQTGVVGIPSDGVRDLPDVSLFAANGIWNHYYVFCYSDPNNGGTPCTGAPYNWAGAGGTSFASPIMAGIQALVNQKAGARQGNPNPVYYKLATTEYGKSGSTTCNSSKGKGVSSTCTFYDVTQGDMDLPCTGKLNCYLPSGSYGVLSTSTKADNPAYGTSTGFDLATGIGTVNAYNLVENWASANTAKTNNPKE